MKGTAKSGGRLMLLSYEVDASGENLSDVILEELGALVVRHATLVPGLSRSDFFVDVTSEAARERVEDVVRTFRRAVSVVGPLQAIEVPSGGDRPDGRHLLRAHRMLHDERVHIEASWVTGEEAVVLVRCNRADVVRRVFSALG